MNANLVFALIIAFSILELAILGGVLFFYLRLRRSETMLNALQGNQEALLARIEMNARLEREIVATFAQRQAELQNLDARLEERAQELRRLLEQAEGISRSPQFLREIILNGRRKGLSSRQIARNAGLSVDEVDLILAQETD
ncbi:MULTISPECIES: hypothetical protein [Desulfovibrio]|uniref:DUF2802 domain-containing protein n=2 Tax=Desulfovibrio TaxID=872 RepID=A0AA94HRN9_DESDE|nr:MULTISPECIES: hypothetical protein [Desulfovibrio]ATD82107.1 hypothetical protein CNY67_12490 [Desulfovibrio sp. G11]SFW33621.1 hypothetical protein SAMN02910291_00894 [Desulfovibrio desulfuricans]SPD34932.1 Hypothetical protein DSVG11_0824 [Desulfovibrio sp. G11]